jgi:hypothetical protein
LPVFQVRRAIASQARKAAGADEAERGQRLPVIGEVFADQIADAAEIAAAGHEGPNLRHRRAAGLMRKCLQRVANLRGKQSLAGEWSGVKGEMARIGGHRGGKILWDLKSLRDVFFFLFLRQAQARDGQDADCRCERRSQNGVTLHVGPFGLRGGAATRASECVELGL